MLAPGTLPALVVRICEPRFVLHAGKEILRLDYSGLSHAELLAAFDTAGRVIRSHPLRSLRILTLLKSHFNAESAEALKRYGMTNRPHVRASAVIGTSFWNVPVMSLQVSGREDLVLFDDEARALDWLAGA